MEHGRFQLETREKNTRKVVRHWSGGSKRWDRHPWRHLKSAGQVPQHPDLRGPALSRCRTRDLLRSPSICMALSCQGLSLLQFFIVALLTQPDLNDAAPIAPGCGACCTLWPSRSSVRGGAVATSERAVPFTGVLQRFALCCAGGIGLIAMHNVHRGALFCAAQGALCYSAALSNTPGDSSESVTSTSTRLSCTSLQHLQFY